MLTSKKAAKIVEVRAAAAPEDLEAPVGPDVTSVVATGARTSEVRGHKAKARVKAEVEVAVAGAFRGVTTAVGADVAANAAVALAIAGDVVSTDRDAIRSRRCRRASRWT